MQTDLYHQDANRSFFGPLSMFLVIYQHTQLILRLAKRDVQARYKGSYLGLCWSLLSPLLMLTIYTFVFSVVFKSRWDTSSSTTGQFALLLFSGLIFFNIFAECVGRAPSLITENVAYVKKVVFPLEILPIVSLLSALFNAALAFLILIAFYPFVLGIPPWTIILTPLVLLPLVLITMGFSWFLASMGVFLRDLRQFIGIFITCLLFLSPLFYPLTAVPSALRRFYYLNPMTTILEQSKSVLFWNKLPNLIHLGLCLIFAWLACWLGFFWFMRTKKGFPDVI